VPDIDYLLKKIVDYRSQPLEGMIKHQELFIDTILMTYLMACFESKELEDLCHYLLPMEPETDEDIEYIMQLAESGSIVWKHKHQYFNPDRVRLCGWIVNNDARRKHAQVTVSGWIEDKKAGNLPEGGEF